MLHCTFTSQYPFSGFVLLMSLCYKQMIFILNPTLESIGKSIFICRSSSDLLTIVSDRIARAFDRSGATRAVALDISKAFDRV